MPEFPCPVIAYRLDWTDGDFYVGSTTYKKLYTRIHKHRQNARYGQVGKHMVKMRELGSDSFTWEELGVRMGVASRVEQGEYEQEFIDELKPTLNTIPASVTPEQRKASDKAWREKNKERLREYNRKFRAVPAHRELNKARCKEWHRDPKNKEQRQKNREIQNAKRRTPEGRAKINAYNNKPENRKIHRETKKRSAAKIRAKKLYACDPCQYVAGNPTDLKRHLNSKRHRDPKNKEQTQRQKDGALALKNRTYVCEPCNKPFTANSSLKRHTDTQHK